jgi:hypothetical protein
MRDRRVRLGLLLLILSFPPLIDALATGRRPAPRASGPALAAVGLAASRSWRVGATECILVGGLTFAGWQRHRLRPEG